MATYYLTPSGGSGTWSSSTNWSSTSGGAGGAGVPGSGDTAYLNAASGNASIAISANTSVGILDMTGFTGTYADNGHNITFSSGLTNGYLTYGTGMTLTLTGGMEAGNTSGTSTITDLSGGSASLYTVGGPAASGANLNFGSNLTCRHNFTLNAGNVNTQGYNLSAGAVNNGATGTTFNFSNSTITLTGSSTTSWNPPASSTLTTTGSTITYPAAGPTDVPTFAGGGYTYNNLTWNYTGAGVQTLTISGNNTFNNFTVTTTTAAVVIKSPAGGTQTCTGTMTLTGASGNLVSFDSTTNNSRFKWSIANTFSPTYVSFADSVFVGAGIPVNATSNCTNIYDNSGIQFNALYDVIQQTLAGTGTASTATSPAIATTTGHMLVALITENQTGNTWTVSDTALNSYTQAIIETNTNQTVAIYYCANVTGNAANTITVLSTGVTSDIAVIQYEVIGMDLSSPLDKTAVGATTGTSPRTASTGTLSQADEVVIGVVIENSTSASYTASTGVITPFSTVVAATYQMVSFYATVAATTALTPKVTTSTSAAYAIAAATFKYTAASGVTNHFLSLLGVGS